MASEIATWGTAAILIACAALPTTDTTSRGGLVFTAALLVAFAAVWFHFLPERVFGRMRFVVGTAISQIIAGILVVLTGDVDSPYFVFYFFPTLAATFAMRVPGTIATGAIAVTTYLAIVVMDVAVGEAEKNEIALGAIRMTALLGTVALATLITRTMEDTRAALRQRSLDLVAQNEELAVAREQLAGRTKVLEGMNQLVEALALGTDERSTAEVAARSISQSFHLVAATTLLTDPSLALLEPVGIAGAATEHPVVKGPANCPAIRSGRIFRVTGAADPVICPYVPFREGTHGYICAPLVTGTEPVGALFMEPTSDSVLEDAFAAAAADRVALAVANRRVLETARLQATTDGLTGLHNRHFLAEQLRLLQSLAERHRQSYAVLAIDIDDLKRVNDTFGHEMGDLALRGFANVVRKTIRGSDLGVRAGGDEFLVLLPRGGLDDARVLADRLRDAVAAQGRSEPHTAITVSLGVAAWRPGRTVEQVLEAADAMLYAAKRAGKDRIMSETATEATGS